MTKTRRIKFAKQTIPVVWLRFEDGNPETCKYDTFGIVFHPDNDCGFKVFINTAYTEEQQRATLLSELWHVVQFALNVGEKYSHKNMHIIMDHIWAMVQANRWLKKYIWEV